MSSLVIAPTVQAVRVSVALDNQANSTKLPRLFSRSTIPAIQLLMETLRPDQRSYLENRRRMALEDFKREIERRFQPNAVVEGLAGEAEPYYVTPTGVHIVRCCEEQARLKTAASLIAHGLQERPVQLDSDVMRFGFGMVV